MFPARQICSYRAKRVALLENLSCGSINLHRSNTYRVALRATVYLRQVLYLRQAHVKTKITKRNLKLFKVRNVIPAQQFVMQLFFHLAIKIKRETRPIRHYYEALIKLSPHFENSHISLS